MHRRDHLPRAVGLQADTLEDLDDFTLDRMQVECLEWLIRTLEFRCEVTAPNAVTVWNALIKLEVAMVVAADSRIDEVRQGRLES
jgi:hypothetical protein